MADSLRLRVLKAMRARLGTIVAGADYHYTWADASVSIDPTTNLLTGVVAGEGPFATVEPLPEGQREYFPADEIKEFYRGTVTVRHDIANVLDPLARMTVVENLIADIERAVAEDYSLGGLVIDTRLGVPQPIVGIGSSMVLVVQPFECRWRREYGVPEGPL